MLKRSARLLLTQGITTMMAGGDIVIHDGEMTGSLPGKVLRHRP